uniref:Uncharacterized protein n=1 Tax=Anguilla anguilla TaxID=7936 RepID=A0A0E9Y1I3_ANGAN
MFLWVYCFSHPPSQCFRSPGHLSPQCRLCVCVP